jgi:hypothetical protein
MSRSSRVYFAVFVGGLTLLMLASLANLEYLQAELSQIERARAKSIVISVTGSTERAMVLIRSLTLTTEEGIKGRINYL